MSTINIVLMFLSLGCISMSLTIIHTELRKLRNEIKELKDTLNIVIELTEDTEWEKE